VKLRLKANEVEAALKRAFPELSNPNLTPGSNEFTAVIPKGGIVVYTGEDSRQLSRARTEAHEQKLAAAKKASENFPYADFPTVSKAVIEALRTGMKIQAIKQLRHETTLGLKDAKDVIDAFCTKYPSVLKVEESPPEFGSIIARPS
jgi:ribosomal protein L7/L12